MSGSDIPSIGEPGHVIAQVVNDETLKHLLFAKRPLVRLPLVPIQALDGGEPNSGLEMSLVGGGIRRKRAANDAITVGSAESELGWRMLLPR